MILLDAIVHEIRSPLDAQLYALTLSSYLQSEELGGVRSVMDQSDFGALPQIRRTSWTVSKEIADQMVGYLQKLFPSLKIPAVQGQLAFELINTIEPLVVAKYAKPILDQCGPFELKLSPLGSPITRTEGKNMSTKAVSLTISGLKHLEKNQNRKETETSFQQHCNQRTPEPTQSGQFLLEPGTQEDDDCMSGISFGQGKRIALLTVGMRAREIEATAWLGHRQDVLVLDALMFEEPLNALRTTSAYRDSIPNKGWLRNVLDPSLAIFSSETQEFVTDFSDFHHLDELLAQLASEVLVCADIGTLVSRVMEHHQIDVAVMGHLLLIREAIIASRLQQAGISVVSVAHSGLGDPNRRTSEIHPDVIWGWGRGDQEVESRFHGQQLKFVAGTGSELTNSRHSRRDLDDRYHNLVEPKHAQNVIVFMSPTQIGTTFNFATPLTAHDGIEKLAKFAEDNPQIRFYLRFHPGFRDRKTNIAVLRKMPKNVEILKTSLQAFLGKTEVDLAVSLQIPTTALIDCALAGIPVRHVACGVQWVGHIALEIDGLVISDPADIAKQLLACLRDPVDVPSEALLSEFFQGSYADLEASLEELLAKGEVTPKFDSKTPLLVPGTAQKILRSFRIRDGIVRRPRLRLKDCIPRDALELKFIVRSLRDRLS